MCMKLSRLQIFLSSALALVLIPSGSTSAQSSKFPKRLITLIVPSAPGGFLEIAARIITKDITERTGTPIIVDFRQGGGGIVGLVAFKQSAPDGQTLLEGNTGPNVINPTIFSNLPYDPIKDFIPLTTLVYTPTVFVVPADSPAKTFAELVALADIKVGGLVFWLGRRWVKLACCGRDVQSGEQKEVGACAIQRYRTNGGGPARGPT